MTDTASRPADIAKTDPALTAASPTPPAGPHDKEELIDREKTPGTGSLPDPGQTEADVGPD